jgi:NO-binding membrane sensor protein with MHYT domain
MPVGIPLTCTGLAAVALDFALRLRTEVRYLWFARAAALVALSVTMHMFHFAYTLVGVALVPPRTKQRG